MTPSPLVRWRRLGLVSIVAVSAMIGAGCAGTGTTAGEDRSETTASANTATAAGLPEVDVLDVADGSTVQLGSLLPAEKPLLVWFWAPH
jgi:ferric-dicitrate binding protein FerR (iron transport regulator)